MNESEIDGIHGKDLRAVGPPFISDVEAAFLVQAFDDDLFSVEGGAVLGGVLCFALAAIASKNRPFMVGSPTKTFDINFYHRCTGYLFDGLLREAAKQQGHQLTGTLEMCEPCVMIKGRKAGVPRTGERAREPGITFHLDLGGKISVSIGGGMYLLVVLDSYSWFVLVYGLRSKSDALAGVKVAMTDLSKYRRANIECFRVDMGTEWTKTRSFMPSAPTLAFVSSSPPPTRRS
ncbi:MAG: hypothetical protein ABJI23_13215 [Marinobacter sp.]|uniref:hypothetical protein n=1 Tax=Marinobacter sp. TaxID=50741 RepID=UPI0032983932